MSAIPVYNQVQISVAEVLLSQCLVMGKEISLVLVQPGSLAKMRKIQPKLAVGGNAGCRIVDALGIVTKKSPALLAHKTAALIPVEGHVTTCTTNNVATTGKAIGTIYFTYNSAVVSVLFGKLLSLGSIRGD